MDAVPLQRLGQEPRRCVEDELAPMAYRSFSTSSIGTFGAEPLSTRDTHDCETPACPRGSAGASRGPRGGPVPSRPMRFADCTAAFNYAALTRQLSASSVRTAMPLGHQILSSERGSQRLASVRLDFGHGSPSPAPLCMPQRYGRVVRYHLRGLRVHEAAAVAERAQLVGRGRAWQTPARGGSG